jgi:hypothetical protein
MFFSLNLIKNVWFGSCNKTKESKKQKYTQKYHFQISMKALKGPFHLISTPPCRRRLRRGPENLYFLGVLKMVISEGNKKIAFS